MLKLKANRKLSSVFGPENTDLVVKTRSGSLPMISLQGIVGMIRGLQAPEGAIGRPVLEAGWDSDGFKGLKVLWQIDPEIVTTWDYSMWRGWVIATTTKEHNPLSWEFTGEWQKIRDLKTRNLDVVSYDYIWYEEEKIWIERYLARALAIAEFLEGRVVSFLGRFVQAHRVKQELDWARGHVGVEFEDLPVFGAFYEAYGIDLYSIKARLLDLGVLTRREIPEENWALSWPIAYAVGPKNVQKIIVLDPLGIVIMRDHNMKWVEVDLVTGHQQSLSPRVRKLLKVLKGGATQFVLFWHRKGDKFNQKCMALEVSAVDRAHWACEQPGWGVHLFQEGETVSHRDLAKLINNAKFGKFIVSELI